MSVPDRMVLRGENSFTDKLNTQKSCLKEKVTRNGRLKFRAYSLEKIRVREFRIEKNPITSISLSLQQILSSNSDKSLNLKNEHGIKSIFYRPYLYSTRIKALSVLAKPNNRGFPPSSILNTPYLASS